jgi:DNA-binding CsgD family transcriptional regulator
MSRSHYSERQGQILGLAARGQSDKEIAATLGVSTHTIRTHLQRLYRDHGINNRAAAVATWLQQRVGAGDTVQPSAPTVAAGEPEAAAPSPAVLEVASTGLPMQTVAAFAQAVLANKERTAAGIPSLDWSEELAMIAQLSARQMAQRGHLGTVIQSISLSDGRPLQAENVGYWSGINDPQLHTLFMADPKQRANIMGEHRLVGAAWAVADNGVAFLSVLFA